MSNLNLKQVTSTVKAPLTANAPVKVLASNNDIAEFVASQVEAPALNYQPIDTSNIDLKQYRLEDADINKVYSEAGWTNIKLVNELGEIVPNARLVVTHKTGKEYSIVPFFPLILTANQAKLELKLESQLKSFSDQGSLKARGSYKFVATPEQIDAMQAKSKMVWEQEVKDLTLNFHNWLNGYAPTTDTLPIVWTAFVAGTTLVKIGEDIYIRQTIKSEDSETVQPLDNPALPVITTTPDLIGDMLISTCYTYQLKA